MTYSSAMWPCPIGDLRTLLSDGPNDKLRAFKQIFAGTQNSVNMTFKTFEFRRVNDFTQASTMPPLGISYNGALLSSSAVSADDVYSGIFTLNFAPTDADILQYTCYIQWFLDTELDGFLVRASNWLGQSDDYSQTPSGLKTACLKYGAHEAYQKLSLKYAENVVETFRAQDSPDEKRMSIVAEYQLASRNALKDAKEFRDDFYDMRKGQAWAPNSRSIRGRIRNPTSG